MSCVACHLFIGVDPVDRNPTITSPVSVPVWLIGTQSLLAGALLLYLFFWVDTILTKAPPPAKDAEKGDANGKKKDTQEKKKSTGGKAAKTAEGNKNGDVLRDAEAQTIVAKVLDVFSDHKVIQST